MMTVVRLVSEIQTGEGMRHWLKVRAVAPTVLDLVVSGKSASLRSCEVQADAESVFGRYSMKKKSLEFRSAAASAEHFHQANGLAASSWHHFPPCRHPPLARPLTESFQAAPAEYPPGERACGQLLGSFSFVSGFPSCSSLDGMLSSSSEVSGIGSCLELKYLHVKRSEPLTSDCLGDCKRRLGLFCKRPGPLE